MSQNKSANITKCLGQIPSRFDLILVAARRARMLQNYDADVAKAQSDLRSQSPIMIATTRAKDARGGKSSKFESDIEQLKNNKPEVFYEENEQDPDKPTIIALKEIQEGFIDKEYLDRYDIYNKMQKDKQSFAEAESLANEANVEIDSELFTTASFEDEEDDIDDFEEETRDSSPSELPDFL